MPVLTTQQRNTLETAVKRARTLAETGARNALHALAVDNPEPFAHMNPEQRSLRNRLRNKARLLGDELPSTGNQQIEHLAYELAYENWHKMLFAKFLESNNLLMHTSGVAVTMEECEELAKEEGFIDKWEAAAAYASKMLPAIFRPEDPLMQVSFASNDRIKLEEILDGLDNYIFTADDALGWVYQFWQSEAKEAINKSGAKINGQKLPAVTQLFTEPYMVHFLIDNTLGAWWVSRHPNENPPVKFEYLRLLDNGTPAAGNFEGWPNTTKEITSLDPCMGSGHFVASLFPVFAALRMFEEGLSKEEATDKVIIENLHGLELDARCTQIAAFNLALTAWKFCEHYKELPEMNLACSGIAPKGKKEDWLKLVAKEPDEEKKQRLESGIDNLYKLFQQAPELGSLIDPSSVSNDLYRSGFEEIQPVLLTALNSETDKDQVERGVLAAGIAKAGEMLSKKYTLQTTNVPYLVRGKHDTVLADYCEKYYPDAKADLANVFLDRLFKTADKSGSVVCVIPQNWLFLTSYKKFREKLLKYQTWHFVARLGSGSFSQISGEVVKAILICISKIKPSLNTSFIGIDVSNKLEVTLKDASLKTENLHNISQLQQLSNPDSRVLISPIENDSENKQLSEFVSLHEGMSRGDVFRFDRNHWELNLIDKNKWSYFINAVEHTMDFGGRDLVILWEKGKGLLSNSDGARITGYKAWGKKSVFIGRTSNLKSTLHYGEIHAQNGAALLPYSEELLLPIWCFVSSDNFNKEVRKYDSKIIIASGSFLLPKFDIEYWKNIAKEKYPDGLPQPYSDDATQWLFHGHPAKAENPLQVATARLLGYRWPAENDDEMELADEAKALIQRVKAFDDLTDDDGILCIPPVNGELAASERLRSYLQAVYGYEWTNSTIYQLLTKEGAKESNLEDWLRTSFFEQHNKLFQNRPFIWHIWDGRKDGFAALVNYHKLDKDNLQRLIFTYLGDWIRQCEAKKKSGESGAEGLLIAALKLKEKLEAILEGKSPYDIFVRWKPLDKQPIGWEPDLNDGVRLNIRPFITADVLRKKPNIKWGVDRGKNPPGSFWGEVRDNDLHKSLEEKIKARENR